MPTDTRIKYIPTNSKKNHFAGIVDGELIWFGILIYLHFNLIKIHHPIN